MSPLRLHRAPVSVTAPLINESAISSVHPSRHQEPLWSSLCRKYVGNNGRDPLAKHGCCTLPHCSPHLPLRPAHADVRKNGITEHLLGPFPQVRALRSEGPGPVMQPGPGCGTELASCTLHVSEKTPVPAENGLFQGPSFYIS